MIQEMQALLNASEVLLTHLKNDGLFKTDRDAYIDHVQEGLAARQQAIDAYEWVKIKKDQPIVFSEEEKAVGEQLVQVDKAITKLLALRMKAHQAEWHQLHKKGKSVSKYRQPFQMAPSDGAFYDKRK